MGRLISEKKADPKGQRDEEAERGSKVEEKEGDQKDGNGGFQSFRIEKRGERFPDLIEDDRNGKEKAAVERQFEEGEEGLGNAEGDQILLKVDLEIAERGFGKGIKKDPTSDDHEDHHEKASSEPSQSL
jgi:hypothetical protein